MLRCNEVTRLIASDERSSARWPVRAAVWLHLRMCHHCRRYASQLRAIARATRKLLGPGSGTEDPQMLGRLERAILEGTSGGFRQGPGPGETPQRPGEG